MTSAALVPADRAAKPLPILLWLEGRLSTQEAIFLALISRDPSAKLWAVTMVEMSVYRPENLVVIAGV